jgi:uncharacterized protein YggE
MVYLKQLVREVIPFSVKTAIVFVAALVLVLLGTTFFVNRSSDAAVTKDRVLSAEGVARRKATPDSARINLGKTLRGKDPVALQTEAATAINKLTDELKKAGVKDEQMSTNNYTVSPSYDNVGKTVSEYFVTISLEVKLEKSNPNSEMINKVLTAGKTANVTDVNGLYFYLADQDLISRELEEAAIADAKSVAEKRAQASGAKLGRVVNVSTGGSGAYPTTPPSVGRPAEDSAGGSGGLNVKPGQIDLEFRVVLSYELL